ncbi:MAG: sugar kinase [Candidatus Lokiarchaeota archaeon]|nr:sugar kinase [Candidatus Lokiarchaeota archaeon]
MAPTEKKRVVTLGEIMVRLKSPGNERLFQSPVLEATFGGGEANVAISLANFGIETSFVTVLPKNAVGDAAIAFLRSMNVDTSRILRQGKRVGVYYLEAGSGPRPSNVIYDRDQSSISEAKPDDFNWDVVFKDAGWFHVTGITPAISATSATLAIAAVKAAKERGLTVSCDLNHRKNLWKYGKTAPEVMKQLMPHVDVVVANEEDIQNALGIQIDQKIGGAELSTTKYETLAKQVVGAFTGVELVAITLRESYSADHNDWSAMCYSRKEGQARISRKYQLSDIVDRVGGGDAFAGGLIYGLIKKMALQDALEFAVVASALKHTIPGDCNRVSVDEVSKLLAGDASGRVQR